MRHIKIERFGPIREIDIDLDKDLEVIIGPQASGKSTFSKTVYFCRKIRDYFLQYLDSVMNTEHQYSPELYFNFLKYIRRPFLGYFGTTRHMEAFRIQYYYERETNRYVTIGLDKDRYAKFSFSDAMKKDICDMIMQAVNVANKSRRSSAFDSFFLDQVKFVEKAKEPVRRIFKDDYMLMYIPAGRNLLAVLPEHVMPNMPKDSALVNRMGQELEIDISETDLITQEFAQYIRRMRLDFGSRLDEIIQNYVKTIKGQIRNDDVRLARKLIREILRADYVYDKDGEKLFYDDEHWVKLMFGSSGQQEIVWALNIIFLAILKNEKTFLVFEEPESHLFPDSQESIAQLVALAISSSKSQVVVTTHSPYMLTAFNLLIYSGEEEGNLGNESAVVRREFRMKPGRVGAYFISAKSSTPESGRLKNIVSESLRLIDAFQIDGISASINDRMDRILYNSGGNGGEG